MTLQDGNYIPAQTPSWKWLFPPTESFKILFHCQGRLTVVLKTQLKGEKLCYPHSILINKKCHQSARTSLWRNQVIKTLPNVNVKCKNQDYTQGKRESKYRRERCIGHSEKGAKSGKSFSSATRDEHRAGERETGIPCNLLIPCEYLCFCYYRELCYSHSSRYLVWMELESMQLDGVSLVVFPIETSWVTVTWLKILVLSVGKTC